MGVDDKSGTQQHYVPQFVLRGFATGRSHQLFVFDKHASKTFKTAVRNVAGERGFYDGEVNGSPFSLDPFFSEVEDRTEKLILGIRTRRSIKHLSSDDKRNIAEFVTVQLLRTNAQRRQFKHVNELFRDEILQRGGDPNAVANFIVLDESESRLVHMQLIPGLTRDLAPNLLDKSWLLYSTTQRQAFYISDNPVAMYNTANQSPDRGTAGLAVPGVEIYFPLSGTLCLGFLCRSLEAWIREGQSKIDRYGFPLSFHGFIEALDGETPLAMTRENVQHHNSMQVINAERYVFSSNGDFELVREMLDTHPELHQGPRYRMA